jgi:ATP-dependent RNA helicase RhlE
MTQETFSETPGESAQRSTALGRSEAAMTWQGFPLLEPIQRAIRTKGYDTPTPIQAKAIPPLMAGRDLIGVAQTGTGKTAAFALPILHALASRPKRVAPTRPRALILTPTRELASQILASFEAYGRNLPLRHTVVFGGVGQSPQVGALRRGVDVLVATPGRLLDLMSQRHISLADVEVFVLDEADRMLDMGFINDVERVIERLPLDRQSLLFSATMPSDIVRLAESFLDRPVRIEVTPPATTVDRVEQRVLFVEKPHKRALLRVLLDDPRIERTLVFTRTKRGANQVAKHLKAGSVQAEAIHGNKSQSAREAALEGFRRGRTRVLVATDIAARGLDVPGITHVINFDLPNVPEAYVHRIGRTARAGRDGCAISFCGTEERPYLRDIERLIRRKVEVVANHPYRSNGTPAPEAAAPPPPARSRRRSFRR